MHDLLTRDETTIAAHMGWRIERVFDARAKRWMVQILPAVISERFDINPIKLMVVKQARGGDRLALKALTLYRQQPQ